MSFTATVQQITQFETLLQKHNRITVLSHINPDPDAIGTSLGVYAWLKEQGYQVEIANKTKDIPLFLDFLPNFGKIKNRIDFDDSLIIACDCGSIDRLGFSIEIEGREIINIDHHTTNSQFGNINIVDSEAASSSEVAYGLLKTISPVSKDSAIAFYAALVSDTRNFTTSNMKIETLELASEIVSLGVDIVYVSHKMLHRRSLASLRILGMAIGSLELREDAQIAVLKISQDDIVRTGAKYSDLDGVVDYGKSLVTAEIALMLIERKDTVKVSIRSKTVDINELSLDFGGGGHKSAGGFEMAGVGMDELTDRLIASIRERGLVR